ncbi:hypothetical protein GCM10023340_20780 [Nocardioides marinquilinus]|uniref:Uncharacterized protein n=1 Tax=Nocardioides marinquilinus TaxID=1210400 RepID=A0ABP9PK24_9ACTN
MTRSARSTRTLAAAALAGVALTGALAAAPAATAAPASGTTASPASASARADQPVEHQRFSYARLRAPGWTAVRGDGPSDGSVAYRNGADTVTLAWHPRGTERGPYTIGERSGATTMDGDRSPIYVFQGLPTAVGPWVNDHFLTLGSTTLDENQLADLAGQVSRTAYATLEADGWVAPVGNKPADEKLYYVGPDGAALSLNWRPADDFGPKWTRGDRVGTTTLDGDRAVIFKEGGGVFTVVARPRDGRFLTLSTTGVSLRDLRTVAPGVHRR